MSIPHLNKNAIEIPFNSESCLEYQSAVSSAFSFSSSPLTQLQFYSARTKGHGEESWRLKRHCSQCVSSSYADEWNHGRHISNKSQLLWGWQCISILLVCSTQAVLISISFNFFFFFFIFHPSLKKTTARNSSTLWLTHLPNELAAGVYGQDWFPIKQVPN